jgi:hypothetical protein
LQELHWELKYFGKNATALDFKRKRNRNFLQKKFKTNPVGRGLVLCDSSI